MPRPANGSLTVMEGEFVRLLTQGVCQTKAAEMAGYAHPDVQAVALVRRPAIREALFEKRQGAIEGVLATSALSRLRHLVESDDVPAHVQFQACRFVLELAGHRVEAGAVDADDDKPLREKSLAEIQASIDRTQQLRDSLDTMIESMKRAEPIEAEQRQVAAGVSG